MVIVAAACAKVGLACEVFAVPAVPISGRAYHESGNVLLVELLGAALHRLEPADDPGAALRLRAAELAAGGRTPYLIPPGGSNEIGVRGYIDCAAEISTQAAERGLHVSLMVHAHGTGGTHAGLVTGLASAAGCDTTVLGMCVGAREPEARPDVDALLARLCPDVAATGVRSLLDDTQLGIGYGIPPPAGLAALSLLARTEGVLLDPVYTAKAMAGLIDLVRAGAQRGDIVFVHTGGHPALFAYEEQLLR